MKITTWTGGWLVGMTLSLATAQAQDLVRETFQNGIALEESGGEPKRTSEAYAEALRLADERQALHASILFRWAEFQRRQGKTAEAAELYRRLLREHPGASDLVASARRQLGESTATPALATGVGESGQLLQTVELRRLEFEQKAAELQARLKRYRAHASPAEAMAADGASPELTRLLKTRSELKLKDAGLGSGTGERVALRRQLAAVERQLEDQVDNGLASIEADLTFKREAAQEFSKKAATLRATAATGGNGDGGPRNDAERLLVEEIRVAEEQLLTEQKKVEVGRGTTEEVLKARRELLSLKRQLAEKQKPDRLDVLPGVSSAVRPSTPTVVPDPETQELERLQKLFRDSPDRLTQDGGQGVPVAQAARNDWLRVLDYLIGEGMPGRQAEQLRLGIVSAIGAGRVEAVRRLLAAGADPNAADSIGFTPLHQAAALGHRAIAELLLDRGAELDAQTTRLYTGPGQTIASGGTPLHAAVANQRLALVKLLLQRGAAPDASSADKRTPLNAAATMGWIEGATHLLESGADPDLGYALHVASARDPKWVALLLDAGADPNLITPDTMMTPLHSVVARSGGPSQASAELLLKRGAYANPGDSQGLTPLDYDQSPKIEEVLRVGGAKRVGFTRPVNPGPSHQEENGIGLVQGALAFRIPSPGNLASISEVPPSLREAFAKTTAEKPAPPLTVSRLLRDLVAMESNRPGFGPDLTRVVITSRPGNSGANQTIGARPVVPNGRYAPQAVPAKGVMMNGVTPGSQSSTNNIAAILESGDASKDVVIEPDGFTTIFVPFKAHVKPKRPTRK
jgi:ankyrin repeat protein